MVERGFWSPEESLASGAEFASELWIGHECTAAEPKCPVPKQEANKWRSDSLSSLTVVLIVSHRFPFVFFVFLRFLFCFS